MVKVNINNYHFSRATRKASVSSVYLQQGSGQFVIRVGNKEVEMNKYFAAVPNAMLIIQKALLLNKVLNNYDVICRVHGGGLKGQVAAIALGISKSLSKVNQNFKEILRFNGLLTTDSRKVQSKQPGLLKARKQRPYKRR